MAEKFIALNSDQIIAIAKEFADSVTNKAYNKLISQMKKRDAEVGGRGLISMTLAQSIGAVVRATAVSIETGIAFDDYGLFVDKGVKGAESTYTESQKSPFKFKQKSPPISAFAGASGWIAKKGIVDRGEVRSKSGLKGKQLSKAVKSMNKRIAFVIAQSVRKKGIKAYHFTDVFDNEQEKFVREISKVLGKRMQSLIIDEVRKIK